MIKNILMNILATIITCIIGLAYLIVMIPLWIADNKKKRIIVNES